ncbi:hypothetical protein [Streptomyces venezuelae]|uniref:hypothetical protein n=1 Tax=Streptomyces venezuelae TaxID=54571 RepID=UPI00363F0082
MNSEEPRQGWPAPPGHPPTGPAGGPGGYGGPQGYGGYAAPAAPSTTLRTTSHRGAWIGAAATLVAAVIGVVGTYLVSSNNSSNSNNAAKPTPPQAQGPATSAGSPQTPESTATAGSTPGAEASATPSTEPPATPSGKPSGKPAGTVEWQGPLAIEYAEPKDLDSAPPAESEIREENDLSVYPFGDHMLRPEDGTKVLVWKDATNKTPSYEECARDIETLGTTTDLKLKTGLVVCATTDDGRLARLTVKELSGLASDTRGVFDVVVWSR